MLVWRSVRFRLSQIQSETTRNIFLEYCIFPYFEFSQEKGRAHPGIAALFFVKITLPIVNSFLFHPFLSKLFVNYPLVNLTYSKVEPQSENILHFQGQLCQSPGRAHCSPACSTRGHFLLPSNYCSTV